MHYAIDNYMAFVLRYMTARKHGLKLSERSSIMQHTNQRTATVPAIPTGVMPQGYRATKAAVLICQNPSCGWRGLDTEIRAAVRGVDVCPKCDSRELADAEEGR